MDIPSCLWWTSCTAVFTKCAWHLSSAYVMQKGAPWSVDIITQWATVDAFGWVWSKCSVNSCLPAAFECAQRVPKVCPRCTERGVATPRFWPCDYPARSPPAASVCCCCCCCCASAWLGPPLAHPHRPALSELHTTRARTGTKTSRRTRTRITDPREGGFGISSMFWRNILAPSLSTWER